MLTRPGVSRPRPKASRPRPRPEVSRPRPENLASRPRPRPNNPETMYKTLVMHYTERHKNHTMAK